MAKTKKGQPPEEVKLEESLTQVTDHVRKNIEKHKVGILVVVLIALSIPAFSAIKQASSENALAELHSEFYLAFKDVRGNDRPDAEIRSKAAQLVDKNLDSAVGVYFALQYSGWLLRKNEAGDQAAALAIFERAQKAHPTNLLIETLGESYARLKADESFVIPPADPKPESDKATGSKLGAGVTNPISIDPKNLTESPVIIPKTAPVKPTPTSQPGG